MTAAGLRPDESCFTNALSACRDRRQGKEAVAILREMDEAGVAPDGVVYTLVRGRDFFFCFRFFVVFWDSLSRVARGGI